MEHVMSYYRCSHCHSITSICSCVERAPKASKHICTACGGVANEWKAGGLFWQTLNEGKVDEAKEILKFTGK